MSFSFFKPSRPKTPQEVVRAIKDSLAALDTKTIVDVKALEKASEEVEKNLVSMRYMLSGDGEVEPNMEQVSQLAVEVCNEDVLTLMVHELLNLGWAARKDLVHCWSTLLKHTVESTHCCVEYIENHLELLDFLVVSYDSKEIAQNCGIMLRECIKFPSLAKYILESASFELFFKFVELPNFDVASDAFSTFKDLLSKHDTIVAEYLTVHYDEFFDLYEKLLTSPNYVTRRQSVKLLSEFLFEPPNSSIMKRFILEVRYLKVMMTLLRDSSKTIQIYAFHVFKVFVANPNKPQEVKMILAKNHEKLVELLIDLSVGKGSEDEQFEEEKEMIIKEISRLSRLPNLLNG
ncbi:Calcium-binding protein 39 [Linum grandiflorum]